MGVEFLNTSINNVGAVKIRDLNYFRFGDNTVAFAVDSSGSIGSRKNDRFREDPDIAGSLLVEVPLKETMCLGLKPVAVYIDLCYGEDEYNELFIKGARNTIESAGLDPNILNVHYGKYDKDPLNSAYGITFVNPVQKGILRAGKSESGDLVYLVALPTDKDYYDKQIRISTVKKILDIPYVHEVLPGGSHGIRFEAEELAKTCGLEFEEGDNQFLHDNDKHSCGAACCVLVTIPADKKTDFESVQFANVVNLYGKLVGEKHIDEDLSSIGSVTACHLDENNDVVFSDGYVLTSAVSDSFSIGNRPEDETHIEDMTDLGCQVIFEAIDSLNVDPLIIVNNLAFQMNDDGKKIIKAARERFSSRYEGFNNDTQFTGSTEDNFPTDQSGIVVRAFGLKKV